LSLIASTAEEKEFRKPTAEELGILNRLLEENFPGVDELRQQLAGLLVKRVDDEGSLSLHVSTSVFAEVSGRIPVEANYSQEKSSDPFAPQVHILLHVLGGLMHELEFYSDDDSPIVGLPNPRELQMTVYPLSPYWPSF
jgi:hypothetical protein